MARTSSHGHFMLLLRVSGVNESTIEERAQEIHDAFMDEYESIGAMTAGLLKLGHIVDKGTNVEQPLAWNFALRYYGPTESVEWLQAKLESVAHSAGVEVTTQTFMVEDITGRY